MTLILLIILLIGLIAGYRRGIILQFLHLIGTISALVIASLNYEALGSRFYLVMPYPSTAQMNPNAVLGDVGNLEYAYYYMFAFFLIFIISKIVIQIIVSGFDYLQQVTTGGLVTSIGGTVLGLIEIVYVLVVIYFSQRRFLTHRFKKHWRNQALPHLLEHTFIISEKLIEWIQVGS
ncbi:CvpA family protein [Jeotgalicoccus sp. WY2]|uniref:CvpA family protein n=1 Tax=Jeotgalicoccus sp. WY2 TaxID=2708346 RepID=UPI0020208EC3|nr:CvpA family protein [Jeotgalicoccus sp. WY2]